MTKELEALDYVWDNYYTEEMDYETHDNIENNLDIIKQALTTKSKREQAWEICIRKHISIWRFRNIVFGYEQKQNGNFVNDTYEYYKDHFGYYHEGFEFELLTEEEFNTLKECLK